MPESLSNISDELFDADDAGAEVVFMWHMKLWSSQYMKPSHEYLTFLPGATVLLQTQQTRQSGWKNQSPIFVEYWSSSIGYSQPWQRGPYRR